MNQEKWDGPALRSIIYICKHFHVMQTMSSSSYPSCLHAEDCLGASVLTFSSHRVLLGLQLCKQILQLYLTEMLCRSGLLPVGGQMIFLNS